MFVCLFVCLNDFFQADRSEPCTIQAVVRTGRNTRGGKGGSLLKAESDGEVNFSVDFTGTDPDDHASGILNFLNLLKQNFYSHLLFCLKELFKSLVLNDAFSKVFAYVCS